MTHAETQRTFVVCGADDELAEATCLRLAREGACLLLAGDDRERLEEVDQRLAQNELHRFVAGGSQRLVAALDAWDMVVDGVVSFSAHPEAEAAGGKTAATQFADVAAALRRFTSSVQPTKWVILHAFEPLLGNAPATRSDVVGSWQPIPLAIAATWEAPVDVTGIVARGLFTPSEHAKLQQDASRSERSLTEELSNACGGNPPARPLDAKHLAVVISAMLGPLSDYAHGQLLELNGRAVAGSRG
jgi:hypothetical protein